MKIKIRSVAIMLPVCLALGSSPVLAIESGIEGATQRAKNLIDGTAPDTLVKSTVAIPSGPGGKWHCAVTCSAEMINPGGGVIDNRYILGVNVDTTSSTVANCDRTVDFDDNPGSDDENRVEVSTTCPFKNLTSNTNHTFYCSARKQQDADKNMTVDDTSMTVTCSDNLL